LGIATSIDIRLHTMPTTIPTGVMLRARTDLRTACARFATCCLARGGQRLRLRLTECCHGRRAAHRVQPV